MSELVEFIRGCLDADEQTARACDSLDWVAREDAAGCGWVADAAPMGPVIAGHASAIGIAAHVARHDPARVLAEVNAKRAILDKMVALGGDDERDYMSRLTLTDEQNAVYVIARDAILEMAQCFRGEPGWRDEWGTQ